MLTILARSAKDDGMRCGRKERLRKSTRFFWLRKPNHPKSMHELSEITPDNTLQRGANRRNWKSRFREIHHHIRSDVITTSDPHQRCLSKMNRFQDPQIPVLVRLNRYLDKFSGQANKQVNRRGRFQIRTNGRGASHNNSVFVFDVLWNSW